MGKEHVYLITGGSGSLGTALTHHLLAQGHKVRTLSRNEHSIEKLEASIKPEHRPRLSTFVGDVRDRDRLTRAFEGVDYVIHGAALKVISQCEYNPREAILTNVLGSVNVVDAAIDADVERCILISTDKQVLPVNCYGFTKGCAEKLFMASNRYCGAKGGKFLVARYGNVWASRGSVAFAFLEQAQRGVLQVTHTEATRFHWTIEEAMNFVLEALHQGEPETIHVPRLPSYRLGDLAEAFMNVFQLTRPPVITGLRPGEKLHESMISEFESFQARQVGDSKFILYPGKSICEGGWSYTSGGTWKLSREKLEEIVATTFGVRERVSYERLHDSRSGQLPR